MKKIAVLASLIVCLTCFAHAEGNRKLVRLSLGGGICMPTDDAADLWRPGFNAMLSLESCLRSPIQVGLRLEYLKLLKSDTWSFVINDESLDALTLVADFRVSPVRRVGRFVPYLLGGVGAGSISADWAGRVSAPWQAQYMTRELRPVAHTGAGMDLLVNPNFTLFVEIRYGWFSVDYGWEDIRYFPITLGVRL